jgi:hypothetical protein
MRFYYTAGYAIVGSGVGLFVGVKFQERPSLLFTASMVGAVIGGMVGALRDAYEVVHTYSLVSTQPPSEDNCAASAEDEFACLLHQEDRWERHLEDDDLSSENDHVPTDLVSELSKNHVSDDEWEMIDGKDVLIERDKAQKGVMQKIGFFAGSKQPLAVVIDCRDDSLGMSLP